MECKVHEGAAPDDAGAGITAGRAAKLLGFSHPDSVRRLLRTRGTLLKRTADGLYDLDSVIAERERRGAAEVAA